MGGFNLITIYLVRHCEAAGQEPEAPLTPQGEEASLRLASYFEKKSIESIVSSPYARAIATVRPLAEALGLEIEIDDRLKERVLSSAPLEDWVAKLEAVYADLDLRYEGGESSREAMARGISVLEKLRNRPESRFVLVTHGALLSLMLKHYQPDIGFREWSRLTNPDLFRLELGDAEARFERELLPSSFSKG